jgi:zinc transport system substrate-binding protein
MGVLLMPKKRKGFIPSFLLLSLMLMGIIPIANAQPEPIFNVAVSVAPLAGLAESVGGIHVQTVILLPEGVEPHAASLPTESITAANDADLLIFSGHFPWEEDLANQTSTPFITLDNEDALEIYEDYGAELSQLPGYEEAPLLAQEHEHEGGNLHSYWLLPKNAIAIANTTRAALTRLNSDVADVLDANLDQFVAEMDAFENLIASTDEEYGFSDMHAIVVFPAEAYVAETFRIEVDAMLQNEDVLISGGELLEVQESLRNGSIDLILGSDVAQLQTGGQYAQQLVEDVGGTLIWWRALFFEGLSDYLSVMTYNLGALTSGLERRTSEGDATTLNFALIVIAGVLGVISLIEGVLLVQRIRAE